MRIKIVTPVLLLLSLLAIRITAFAEVKPPCIITGPQVVCTNQSANYTADVNNPAYTYQWVITGGSLLSQSANGCAVQWTVPGTGSVAVNIYQNGTLINTCTLPVNVYNMPSPNIVPSFEASCSENPDPGGETVASVGRPKEDPCSKVCENSTVVYRVSYHAGSTYQWVINGLSTTSVSGANSNVFTVNWGTVSSGTLQVTETNAAGCSKTVYKCIQIIAAPIAAFNTTPAHSGGSLTICRDQTVTFQDISTATSGSPIVSWVWDFGDGSGTTTYTAGASVTHQYTNDNGGTPYVATLTVKNACGCENTFRIRVYVSRSGVPKLVCPSTVCCGKLTRYSITHANDEQLGCGYTWSVTGGTLVSPAPGQTADEASIIWDCGPTPKTITLTPVNCNACNNPIVYDIPVISSTANINGKTIVCPSSEEVYSIPAMPGCNFTWTLSNPAAGVIYAGSLTNSIKVRWNSSFSGTVTLQVHYVNTVFECEGTGTLDITLRPALVINASAGSICSGNPITYTSATEFGGIVNVAWQINQLPSGTNIYNNPGLVNTINYTFGSGGDFEVVAIDNSGSTCNSPAKLIQTITGVPPQHSGTVNGQTTNLCPGQTYMYTATPTSADYNLVWDASPTGTVSPTSGNKVNIVWTGTAPGQIKIYQVSKTNPACTSVVRVINVLMVQPPSCAITGNFNPCPNSTFAYSATAGLSNYTWSISPASAGSIISGQGTNTINVQWHNTNVNVNATLNVGIQYCGTNVQNCSSSTIVVSPAPAITLSPLNASICVQASQLFTVGGITSAGTVTWNWGDGTPNTSGPALSATHAYSAPGTYNITVVVQQPNNCFGATATTSTTVSVNSRPTVSISLGGTAKTKLCPNEFPVPAPATLVATIISGGCGANGVIQWYKNGIIITGATGASYQPAWPATAGTTDFYTFQYSCPGVPCGTVQSNPAVQITRAASCTTCTLAALPNPTLVWTETPASACGSGSLTYTAPSPGYAVQLDFDDLTAPVLMPPNNPNSGTVSHTYTKAGIYHPTLYTKYPSTTPGVYCDFLRSAEVVVPVIAKNVISVVCNPAGGYNIVVNDISDRLATYSQTPVRKVSLDGATPVSMGASTTYTFVGVPAGNHSITFTIQVSDPSNTYQCSVTNPAILPVLSVPSITTNGNPRCVGAPVQFSTNATNAASWNWQFGDGTSSLLPGPTHQYNTSFSPVTVSLQVVTNEGCVVSNTSTLNILPNNLGVTVSSPSGASPVSICQGAAGPVLNAVVTGANGAPTYSWNTTTLNNISTNSSIVAGSQASDRYMVTVTDAIGCRKQSAAFEVIVKPAPVASIIGRDEYCEGEVVSLAAQQGNGYTYQWLVNGANYGTFSSIAFSAVAGNYTVQLTVSSNGCSSVSTMTVRVNSKPYVYVTPGFNSQLCAGQPNTITANIVPGTGTAPFTYYWNTVPVQNTASVTVSNAGLYQATVIDANGCRSSDQTRVYRVEDFSNFMSGCYDICNDKRILLVGPKSPSIAVPPPNDNVPYEIVYSYQWYKDGNPIPPPDGTNPDYWVDPAPGPYSGSGQYTLSITSMLPSAGCEANSLSRYEKSFNVNFVECCTQHVEVAITNIICLNYATDPIRYAVMLQVYNPYPGPATITFNSPQGPFFTVPAGINLPQPGWNTVTAYFDDLAGIGKVCLTGGTITFEEKHETCNYVLDICAELPACENICPPRPTCECLNTEIMPTIGCSRADPIPGYQYAYDFTVTFGWGCRSIAIPRVFSPCGIFGPINPQYISGGTNVVSGIFYSNQPPGTPCNFTVILYDDNGKELCRFCVTLRLVCRGGAAEEKLYTINGKGAPAAAGFAGSAATAKVAGKTVTAATAAGKPAAADNRMALPNGNKELAIVPNPASSYVTINYSFSREANNSIVIYNLLGNPVKTISGLSKSGSLRVDISTLAGGTYIVKALGNDKIVVARLEVLR